MYFIFKKKYIKIITGIYYASTHTYCVPIGEYYNLLHPVNT